MGEHMTNFNLYQRFADGFPEDADGAPFAEIDDGRHFTYGDLERTTARAPWMSKVRK